MPALKLPFVNHPVFDAAAKQAFAAATLSPPGTLVLVVGPSGGGKSTLRALLESQYVRQGDPSEKVHMPVVSLTVVNADKAFFSPKDFASRYLAALNDPFRGCTDASKQDSQPRVSRTEMDMWRAAEHLTVAKRVRLVLLDEANLLALTSRHRSPSNYLERLKVFAEVTGVILVLFATYDFLRVWNHSAQLNRRMVTIHLRPYDFESKDDVRVVRALLRNWSRELPLSTPLLLDAHARAIAKATFGAVGEIASFLSRVEISRSSRTAASVEAIDIDNALPTRAQIARGWEEVDIGLEALDRVTLNQLNSVDSKIRP